MIIDLKDNNNSKELSNEILNLLIPYACDVKKLIQRYPGLLIYPQCLGYNNDGIEDSYIYKIDGKTIKTGNLAGFISVNGVNINICSRFDNNEKQYFLHYLLQKVTGINLFDLPTGVDNEPIWNWLPYLFPIFLNKALKQGVFRTYKKYAHNNNKLKGNINFVEHIRYNIPFNGKIAYNTREHSADNYITQLIRHTIEFLRRRPETVSVLQSNKEIRDSVSFINQITPLYKRQELSNIIFQNLKIAHHPYYTEYLALQQLCLKILRNEKIANENDDQKIHGILFDVAWLWEEYLATILKSLDFQHPQNKNQIVNTPFKIYNKFYEHEALINVIPDFYNKTRKIIADAKYKKLENELISREDRFQIISYLHITQYNHGIIIYPTNSLLSGYQEEGTLNGFGGHIGKIGVQIPNDTDNFADFCSSMAKTEIQFQQCFESMLTEN